MPMELYCILVLTGLLVLGGSVSCLRLEFLENTAAAGCGWEPVVGTRFRVPGILVQVT